MSSTAYKVRHLDKNVRDDVKRYLTLKARKDAIESEMSQIRQRLEQYVDSCDSKCVEDSFWSVSKVEVERVDINKSKFVEVYGADALDNVSTRRSYVQLRVRRKK